MSFRDELPNQCPPAEAEEICETKKVFRIIDSTPATSSDFVTVRQNYPGKAFECPTKECCACGISVLADRDACENALRLPKWRGKSFVAVKLLPGAGKIQNTFKPGHITWWPFGGFDILANCESTGP